MTNDSITLTMGDCLELLPELKGNSADLIICDINYGTLNKTNPKTAVSNKTFSQKELKEFCKQIRRVLNNNGTLIFFAKELVTVDIINLMRRDYKYRYVWKKGNKTTNFLNASFQPLCNHEDILVFQKPSTPKKKHVYVYNPLRDLRVAVLLQEMRSAARREVREVLVDSAYVAIRGFA